LGKSISPDTVTKGESTFGLTPEGWSTCGLPNHVFAAYVGNGNGFYHDVRKDADSQYWSSKNGPDPPTQNDSHGNKITDPSRAYFELEGVPLKFCGYFSTSPGLVCPTPSDCVRGEYGRVGSRPWPGCGLVMK
jgi:hypothetical protein